MSDPTWLTEIEERVAKATPGPWKMFTDPSCTKLIVIGEKNGEGIADCGFGVWRRGCREVLLNAALIAHAPTDLTRFIAEYRKVREALESAKEALLSDPPSGPQKTIGGDDTVYHLSGQKVYRALNLIRTALTQDDER